MPHVTRTPEGKLLGAAVWYGRPVWVELQEDDPKAGLSRFAFILKGKAEREDLWFHMVPWEPPWNERQVITYDSIVHPRIDFIRYLRARARGEEAPAELPDAEPPVVIASLVVLEQTPDESRIPSRRRRHDGA